MGVHLATGRIGIGRHIGMGIKLGEELLNGGRAQREHERLVAIVARAKVAFAESPRHGDLGKLLPVAKNAELGPTVEYLATADNACLPALHAQFVIAQDFSGAQP